MRPEWPRQRGGSECQSITESVPATDWSSCRPRGHRPDASARADALFTVLDADNDGAITEDEFKDGARALLRGGHHAHGYGRHGRLDRALDRLFDRVDADGDGALSRDEVVAALSRRRGAPAPPASDPVTEPGAPVIEPATAPLCEPVAEPVCEPGESSCQPVDSSCEPVAEPVCEPVAEWACEPVAESGCEPAAGALCETPADAAECPAPAEEVVAPAEEAPAATTAVTATGVTMTVVVNFTFSLAAVQSYAQTSQLAVTAALRVVANA
jgi:hypothetical protein